MKRCCLRFLLTLATGTIPACAAPRSAPSAPANPWPASSDQRLVIAYQANLLGEIEPCG